MTDSGLALSVDVKKAYFIELINTYFQGFRFNGSVDVPALGKLEVFLDSFQVIEIFQNNNRWIIDLSTITKIVSQKRNVSLAGLTNSEVTCTLSNDESGDIFLEVDDIDFDWKALKTRVNGRRKKGMDGMAKTLLNLAENSIAKKLGNLISSWFNDLPKPFSFELPSIDILNSGFYAEFHIPKLILNDLSIQRNQLVAQIKASIESKLYESIRPGILKIDKISLEKATEFMETEVISKFEVMLSDEFVSSQINSYVGSQNKMLDLPFTMQEVSIKANDGEYNVQLETDDRKAKIISFNLRFFESYVNSFPEIQLSDYQMQGKGLLGILAKQLLKLYEEKLSTLASLKWTQFISKQIEKLKAEGVDYKWKGLSVHVPIRDIVVLSPVISQESGMSLTTKLKIGLITITEDLT